MGMTPARQAMDKKEIHFPNGNTALSAKVVANTPAVDILHTLGIHQPKALLLLVGETSELDDSSDDSAKAHLMHLCNLGVARITAEVGAMIVDGGTHAGIMAMIGQSVTDWGHQSILLGVLPAGMVTFPDEPANGSRLESVPLDHNHSHFVLVEGDNWGDETSMMYQLADALSKDEHGQKIPIVTILLNGGQIAKHEVLCSVRRGWPVIVITGSSGTADIIATLWREKNDHTFIPDLELAEIIAGGNIHLFPLTGPIEQFEVLLKQLLMRPAILTEAWEYFALYDANAKRQQTNFSWLQGSILVVGVLATAFVVIQTLLRSKNVFAIGSPPDQVFHIIIVFLPIVVSILLAGASRFKPGNKWVLLRASAEAIKREIYRYRTQTGIYKKEEIIVQSSSRPKLSSQDKFTEKIKDITRQLMLTDVNMSALRQYRGRIPPKMDGAEAEDDGYSRLTPDQYITIRIGDQTPTSIKRQINWRLS